MGKGRGGRARSQRRTGMAPHGRPLGRFRWAGDAEGAHALQVKMDFAAGENAKSRDRNQGDEDPERALAESPCLFGDVDISVLHSSLRGHPSKAFRSLLLTSVFS